MVAGCKAPRCQRCAVLGYATEDCQEKCPKCEGDHATVDCTLPRTYTTTVFPPNEGPLQENSQTTAAAVLDLSPAEPQHSASSCTGESLCDTLPTPGQHTPQVPKSLWQQIPG